MDSINHGTVSAEQELRLIGPDRMIVPLMADMHYSSLDPYAVRLSFDSGMGEPVVWAFSRELLAAALRAPEGMGDVRVWPSKALDEEDGIEAGAGLLNIILGPPSGYARFETRASEIAAFLARTYELVPSGHESDRLDLDAELAELLSEA